MKSFMTKFLVLALTTTALSGCGTYRDPLAMMADPSRNAIPQDMSLPVNQAFSFTGYVKGSHEAFTFFTTTARQQILNVAGLTNPCTG